MRRGGSPTMREGVIRTPSFIVGLPPLLIRSLRKERTMNRKIIFAVVLIFTGHLFGPSLSTAQQQRGQTVQPKAVQRTALVIGNSNYEQGPLRNPANDARAMGNSLKDLGFDVTLHFNLNLRQMDEAVRGFGQKIKDGGIGLFYFAGHGVQV